jgi:hypothetical protein
MASRTAGTLAPVLAEMEKREEGSRPKREEIWEAVVDGEEVGRSICRKGEWRRDRKRGESEIELELLFKRKRNEPYLVHLKRGKNVNKYMFEFRNEKRKPENVRFRSCSAQPV